MAEANTDSDQNKDDKSVDDENKNKENEEKENEDLDVKYTPEELTRRLMNTADENKKFRKQRNDARDESNKLRDQLKQQENEKLADQGKYKELNEQLTKDLEQAKTDKKSDAQKYATQSVISAFQREAIRMGVTNEKHLKTLIQVTSWNELEVDENFSPRNEDVKTILAEQKKEHPYWFTGKKLNIVDADPSVDRGGQNSGDRAQYLDELKKCKTQADLNKVYAKYPKFG